MDPARHPFDSESAARVVRSLGPAQRVPRRPDVPPGDRPTLHEWSWDEARPWSEAMTYALTEHYGRWVTGWRWAHDEGDFDGGPVGSWCCAQHSVTTVDETLDRVTAGLREWREWLESLAARFEAYPLDLAGIDDQRILWDRTARHLILHVTDRTGCGSGWYGHCHQVLEWFLSRWGVGADDAEHLVARAIGGRFESWTGPDPVLVEDIAERLAASVRPDPGHARATAAPQPARLRQGRPGTVRHRPRRPRPPGRLPDRERERPNLAPSADRSGRTRLPRRVFLPPLRRRQRPLRPPHLPLRLGPRGCRTRQRATAAPCLLPG
ncbi:hypothetical protein [Streptomyces herbicida]|uniref:hypothetical protein n=1 Tax=Streptomyces herbicida TaxID=3065675 RepID=UPI0029307D8F|nr:hypothetical protein [Streptomyces sp. NEAU-HV9]